MLKSELKRYYLNNEQLLRYWLEDKLSGLQRQVFEKHCIDDESFAKQVDTVNIFMTQAEHY